MQDNSMLSIFHWQALLAIMGFGICLLSSTIIIQRRRLQQRIDYTNVTLCAFLIILALIQLQRFFTATGLVHQHPHLVGLTFYLLFLEGPLLYFYLQNHVNKHFYLSRNNMWHFSPALISLFFLLPIFLAPIDVKREFVSDTFSHNIVSSSISSDSFIDRLLHMTAFQQITTIQLLAILIQLIFYALLFINIINKHRKTVEDLHSSTDKITLSWLKNLAITVLITISIILLATLFSPFSKGGNIQIQIFSILLSTGLCFYVSFHGIVQPIIYQRDNLPEKIHSTSTSAASEGVNKYEKSGLSEEGRQAFYKEIETLMRDKKPYTQNGLTVAELAAMLNMPPAYLSQTINAEAGMSFFDFINSYRIIEAKEWLNRFATGQKEIILSDLYLEAGFNSKSSFYAQFKKHTDNLTPSEYLKTLDKETLNAHC